MLGCVRKVGAGVGWEAAPSPVVAFLQSESRRYARTSQSATQSMDAPLPPKHTPPLSLFPLIFKVLPLDSDATSWCILRSMTKQATSYSVRELARLAGVSVRTLHHYDQIGLLTPSTRTAAGYRQYGSDDLMRLQQILFFKELDVPLGEIRAILDDPQFDQREALENHRRLLHLRAERLAQLIRTVDKTILNLMEDTMTLTDEELYQGFSKEQIESYQQEAQERWGATDAYQESQRRVRNMTKAQWNAVKQQGDEATRQMASLMGRDPADTEVQAAIAGHHAWIENFYRAPAELYAGLGQMYAEDERFRAYYDAYAPDLADFMRDAMQVYADTVLASRA